MREITFANAILEATEQLLEDNEKVYVMGLGVPDPKGIFGTTLGLQKKFGSKRVMDMPTSENAMTGVAIGSAIMGARPIMTHQRVDFFLLALDQLINNAAKWNYMFAGKMEVPLVIRLIVGRGWGQGPQHSQSLHSLFAHIPGLKVVAPATAYDAKGLLMESVSQNHPVVFLEHRWLHHIKGIVPENRYQVPMGKASVVKEGKDITVIASSYMVVEAYQAIQMLGSEVSVELVDLRSLKPLDEETLYRSVNKTKKVVVLDGDWKTCGYAAEIITRLIELGVELTTPPKRITYPDTHQGTSWALSNQFYPTPAKIASEILSMIGKVRLTETILQKYMNYQIPLDQPNKEFTGPF